MHLKSERGPRQGVESEAKRSRRSQTRFPEGRRPDTHTPTHHLALRFRPTLKTHRKGATTRVAQHMVKIWLSSRRGGGCTTHRLAPTRVSPNMVVPPPVPGRGDRNTLGATASARMHAIMASLAQASEFLPPAPTPPHDLALARSRVASGLAGNLHSASRNANASGSQANLVASGCHEKPVSWPCRRHDTNRQLRKCCSEQLERGGGGGLEAADPGAPRNWITMSTRS